MMTRKGMVLIGVLSAFILLGLVAAHAADSAQKITGKVKDVDLDEQSVVVGGPGGDIVVYMESGSKITMGGQAKTLKDVKVGGVVEVDYVQSGSDKVIRAIRLTP